MSFVNKTNHQYIQGRVASNEGVRCQAGGAHDYDRDILKSSYGFTKEGADLASELKGSYAAITSGVTRHNQCGGKKKKKSYKKKMKKKSRKKKRKSRKNKRKSRRKKTKKRRRKKYRGGNCNFKLNKFKRHTGGAYSQYGSNEPNSPTYSFEPTTTRPWALGPGNFKRTVNKF